jgi:hypothetical protein
MPWKLFEQLLRAALRPLSDLKRHPGSFYQGLLLVAIDGTEFSVANTPQVLGQLSKAASRRFQAAFAKIGICVLVEVGQHNPIAAAIGQKGNCELALAQSLWSQVPKKCLLLADRLYGTACTINQLIQELQSQESQCLIRVRSNLKIKVLESLADGSALIQVRVAARHKPSQTQGVLHLREIRARVRKAGMAQVREVRLWTTLMDAKAHPAQTLLELYTRRWEEELYYHQLKIDLRSTELLQSHTVHTAAQELAALVLASALLARQRLECADQAQVETLNISFSKVLEATRALWHVLEIGQNILTPSQAQQLVELQFNQLQQSALLGPRRKRNCPRALRQPIKKWPRLIHNHSFHGQALYEVLPVLPSIS